MVGGLVGGYELPQQMRKLDTEQEERHQDGIRESADRQKIMPEFTPQLEQIRRRRDKEKEKKN